MSHIQAYTHILSKIFSAAVDPYEAHQKSQTVLLDMTANQKLLGEILDRYVQDAKNINQLNFPALGFTVFRNAHYGLALNCFFSAQNNESDLTANSIHHHGPSLLSTVTCFGPGYEHWLFSKPKTLNLRQDLFEIQRTEQQWHSTGHYAFVDAHIPHAVFFPPSLSITYALWSSQKKPTWKDYLKHSGLAQKNQKLLSYWGKKIRVANTCQYYDYFPVQTGFRGMRERVQFQRGPNQDYLHGLLHVMQETGFESVSKRIQEALEQDRLDNPECVRALLQKLKRGDKIERVFTPGIHTQVPHMIFSKGSIEQALIGQKQNGS